MVHLARNRANWLVCLHFCNSTSLRIRFRSQFVLKQAFWPTLGREISKTHLALPPPTEKEEEVEVVVNKHRSRARILDNRIWMLFVNW